MTRKAWRARSPWTFRRSWGLTAPSVSFSPTRIPEQTLLMRLYHLPWIYLCLTPAVKGMILFMSIHSFTTGQFAFFPEITMFLVGILWVITDRPGPEGREAPG